MIITNTLFFYCYLSLSILSLLVTFGGTSAQQLYKPVTNYRVSPGLGDRATEYVRITAVVPTNETHSPEFESFFSYSGKPFQYVWQDKKLYTTLKQITPSLHPTVFTIGTPSENVTISVTVPLPGAGVKGIITADICAKTQFATCEVDNTDDIGIRIHDLLNAALSGDDINYLVIGGDVFYDGDGTITPWFYDQLNPKLKNKQVLVSNGNWDLWTYGDHKKDPAPYVNQYGNGFMQMHGQDTMASKADPLNAPYDFSVNPYNVPNGSSHIDYLAATNNFLSYNQIGNVGFIIFTGANHLSTMSSFFAEACGYFEKHSEVARIFVVGHWIVDDKGCASNKTITGNVYEYITATFPNGCHHHRVRYFTGHTHCNKKISQDGFLVGGWGKDDKSCRNFGLPFVDSTNGRLLVAYFPILHNDESLALERLTAHKKNQVKLSDNEVDKINHLLGNPKERYFNLLKCASSSGGMSSCVSNPNVEMELWLNESLI